VGSDLSLNVGRAENKDADSEVIPLQLKVWENMRHSIDFRKRIDIPKPNNWNKWNRDSVNVYVACAVL
jgi:hypothetical protein